jgi:hypothetical protein
MVMTVVWLIVLLIYGSVVGFGSIPALAWLLLIPMAVQDIYDHVRKA